MNKMKALIKKLQQISFTKNFDQSGGTEVSINQPCIYATGQFQNVIIKSSTNFHFICTRSKDINKTQNINKFKTLYVANEACSDPCL